MANVREATLTLKVDATGAKTGLLGFTSAAGAAEAIVGRLTGAVAKLFVAWQSYRFLRDSIHEFSEFERQIAKVSTVLDRQTMYLLPGYTTAIRKLSIELGESTGSLADGMYEILQAMIPPEKALVVLEASAKAAAAGMTTTKVSVDAVTTILNAYGIAAEKAAKVTSDLYEAALVGKMTYEDVAESIGHVASSAAVAGVSLEELMAAMATLTRAGIRPDRAATSLRFLIGQYMTPSNEAIQTARSMGLELGAAELHAKGLLGVLDELSNKSPDFITQMMGQVRGFTGLAAALQNLSGLHRDYNYILRESGQDLVAYEKMMATPAKQFERFTEAMKSIQRNVGAILAPSLAEAASKVANWVGDNGEQMALMSAKVENEIGRIKDILVEFTRYLRNDFAGASRLAWDAFMRIMEVAGGAAIDLAYRTGQGIWQKLRDGVLGNAQAEAAIQQRALEIWQSKMGTGTAGVDAWTGVAPGQNPLFTFDQAVAQARAEDAQSVYAGFRAQWGPLLAGVQNENRAAAATSPMGPALARINAAHDARAGQLQGQLDALSAREDLGQKMQAAILWPMQKVADLWNKYVTPYGEPQPTYAAGVEQRLTGENPLERYTVDETIRKINLEKRMLTETTEQRAQSLALEQLEQDALEKRLKLDEKDKDAVKAAAGELEKAKRLSLTAKDIGAAFTQTFDDIVLGAKSASQAVQAMLMDIARAMVHNLITQPIGDTLAAAISHWLIGTVTVPAADANVALAHTAHSGWQVGSAGGAARRVPAGLFWAAPRLHSGLASDEFPAILQTGETVLSRAQSAAALRPSLTVHVTNTSVTPVNARVTDLKLDLRRLVVGILLEDQQTHGPVSRGYGR